MPGTDLHLKHIRHRYGSRLILDIVEFKLRAGDCVLLTGENGAGKTTLMKILAGLLAPTQAEISLGSRWKSWRQARPFLVGQSIYLHQQVYLFDSSVAENIEYGLRLRHESTRNRQQKVQDSLDWAGLSQLASQPAHTLSGGERQRLALCRARVLDPDFLLLDEPTANLDPLARQQSLKLLEDLREAGTGILLSSHYQSELMPQCSRHCQLIQGKLGNSFSEKIVPANASADKL